MQLKVMRIYFKIDNNMKKLTQEQLKEIRELSKLGKTQRSIAEIMKVSPQTINYWLLDDNGRKKRIKKIYENEKKKPIEERKKIYKKRVEYLKNYQYKRYHSDEEFRKYRIRKSREHYYKMKGGNEKNENI